MGEPGCVSTGSFRRLGGFTFAHSPRSRGFLQSSSAPFALLIRDCQRGDARAAAGRPTGVCRSRGPTRRSAEPGDVRRGTRCKRGGRAWWSRSCAPGTGRRPSGGTLCRLWQLWQASSIFARGNIVSGGVMLFSSLRCAPTPRGTARTRHRGRRGSWPAAPSGSSCGRTWQSAVVGGRMECGALVSAGPDLSSSKGSSLSTSRGGRAPAFGGAVGGSLLRRVVGSLDPGARPGPATTGGS